MAKDKYHDYVKQALENDGWTITADPYQLAGEDVELSADLAAERLLVAAKGKEEIVVEVKSFTHPSIINSFHTAVGQYLNYNYLLKMQDKNKTLYLAIRAVTYHQFLARQFFMNVIAKENIKLIIIDSDTLTVKKWIR